MTWFCSTQKHAVLTTPRARLEEDRSERAPGSAPGVTSTEAIARGTPTGTSFELSHRRSWGKLIGVARKPRKAWDVPLCREGALVLAGSHRMAALTATAPGYWAEYPRSPRGPGLCSRSKEPPLSSKEAFNPFWAPGFWLLPGRAVTSTEVPYPCPRGAPQDPPNP
ncbi:hypothetical protein NDU88_007811 [Pleurodeles waltl]|uniref:Uncharacterized protein n=1 Tax=Pleurodeles waltl TaxID=8319 RepID=A0AAV7N362_PLEWA|nr:hypothetical protein NDU88_007811 [Pleurodeles waltl]